MLTHHEIIGLLAIWLSCGYAGFIVWFIEAFRGDFYHKIRIVDWFLLMLLMITFGMASLLMSFMSLRKFLK